MGMGELADVVHPQSNKVVLSVKIMAIGDSKKRKKMA